jgi:SAM-dependent methyltransferase
VSGLCPLCAAADLRPLGAASGIGLVRCATCGSVMASTPAPEPSAYGLAYYERSYLAFKSERLAFLARLLGRLGDASGRLALDCGCGAGLSLDVLSACGWRAVGIEPSPAGAALVAQRGHAVVRGSASVLPASSHRADAVLLLDVLAHLDDPAAAVHEAARVLAPGGRILVKTPHRPAWAYWLAARLPGRVGRGLMHLPHQRYAISRRGLAALLLAAGFEDVEVRRSTEAIPLRSHLAGSWAARARVILVAAFEFFYGGPSSVATGALRAASAP